MIERAPPICHTKQYTEQLCGFEAWESSPVPSETWKKKKFLDKSQWKKISIARLIDIYINFNPVNW